jgi:tetratricopeptide (TPR) repeat protein
MKFLLLLATLFWAAPLVAETAPQQMLNAGQVDEAIRVLTEHVKSSPNNAAAHNLLCRAYFMIEDWDRGIPSCERATQLDPQKSLYFDWLGRIYGEKADHSSFFTAAGLAKKVRSAFERAVQLDPMSEEARVDLGEFYAEAPGIVGGGKDKARQQANALMSFKPAMAYWVLARIDEKDKDLAAAERDYRAAITASNGGVRAWFDLGNFFFHRQRFDEMEQAFRQLESAPADCPESLLHGAQVLQRANRNSALAIRLLQKYLASPVEHGPAFTAHDLLGQYLEKKGDPNGAAEQYRVALSLWRGDAQAKEALVRLQH